jgi:hypothetical protein
MALFRLLARSWEGQIIRTHAHSIEGCRRMILHAHAQISNVSILDFDENVVARYARADYGAPLLEVIDDPAPRPQ